MRCEYQRVNICIRLGLFLLLFVLLTTGGSSAQAEELKAGTVINASNFDQLLPQTFEGHTIESMLTERLKHMIKHEGLTMKLRPYEKYDIDHRWVEATNKYAKDVKYDPATRICSNYKAGLPFPEISEDDPHAGTKVIWNWYYGEASANNVDLPNWTFVFVDGKKGIDKQQTWSFAVYNMIGRVEGDPILPPGNIRKKTNLYAIMPYDIRGLGTHTIRYDDGRVDDTWAYIRSVRRVRRLTGGAWMDPIGGTDQLQDDINCHNAYPTWYPEYKLIGKKWVLAVAHSLGNWNPDGKNMKEQIPALDSENAPYWNPIDEWEPRLLWIVEATTPREHPYSKKILYCESEWPRIYHAECYDKKGEFWKNLMFNLSPFKTSGGLIVPTLSIESIVDFKRRHATVGSDYLATQVYDKPGLTENDVSLEVLRRAASMKQ